MGSIPSIDEVKRNHDALYATILQKRRNLTRDGECKEIIEKINRLLEIIKVLSGTVDTFDEYRWLSDTAIKWQSVFSTFFEIPRSIELSPPKKKWLHPVPSFFSEDEIDNWLKSHAAFTAYVQRAQYGRQVSEKSGDWHTDEIFFASEVLDGRINFVSRLSSRSYWRLENIWLEEVKCLLAYCKWEEDRIFFSHHKEDFFCACDHIRDMLINKKENGIKARPSEFKEAQDYIQQHYLGDDGKLRLPAEQATKLHKLIELKAYRIFETTGSKDGIQNWLQAETYIKMFYENIIPAVMKDNSEKVLRVLKAFQYSKTNRFVITNCFEATLAIYFLNPVAVQSLWDDSAKKPFPESTVESIVEVDSWPQGFTIEKPCKMRFRFDKKSIGFKGVMLEIEKAELLDALDKATSGNPKSEHKVAIEKLYDQSRLIHKETTL